MEITRRRDGLIASRVATDILAVEPTKFGSTPWVGVYLNGASMIISPDDARHLAEVLVRVAGEAEGSKP